MNTELANAGTPMDSAQLTTLVYGPWLQQQFTLTPTLLGVVSIVIGVADLLAELAAALFIDRLGKWRALIGSTGLYIAALLFFGIGVYLSDFDNERSPAVVFAAVTALLAWPNAASPLQALHAPTCRAGWQHRGCTHALQSTGLCATSPLTAPPTCQVKVAQGW